MVACSVVSGPVVSSISWQKIMAEQSCSLLRGWKERGRCLA
jgi:hypothetical protein